MEATLKQLRYLVTVVETGSFRRAAERLGISQPTLTAQIAQLEKTLAASLLERSRQGTIATPIGRSLLPHAYAILQESRELRAIARHQGTAPSGVYRLGAPASLAPYLLPYVTPAMHKAFPDLHLYVQQGNPKELEYGLEEGIYDVILTPLPLGRSGMQYEILFQEPLRLVTAPQHQLTRQDTLQAAQLAGETFLALNDQHHFFRSTQEQAADMGFSILREYETSDLDSLRIMISTGMGVSFLPALYLHATETKRQDIAVLTTDFPLPERRIALAWRPQSPQKHSYQRLARVLRHAGQHALPDVVQWRENR